MASGDPTPRAPAVLLATLAEGSPLPPSGSCRVPAASPPASPSPDGQDSGSRGPTELRCAVTAASSLPMDGSSRGNPIPAPRGPPILPQRCPESTPPTRRSALPLRLPSPLGRLPHPGEPRPPPALPQGSPSPHPRLCPRARSLRSRRPRSRR